MARKRLHRLSSLFFRAATQRRDEARFLLAKSTFTTASIYLAGYAVECALKALLLRSESPSQNKTSVVTFRGQAAHNYDWLKHELAKRSVGIPSDIVRLIAKVNWWGTEMRYQTRQVERRVAEEFLKSVDAIIEWVQGRF